MTNKYILHFKDGTNFESEGSCKGVEKSTIAEEMDWLKFHMQKELIGAGKNLTDLVKIEITMDYVDE